MQTEGASPRFSTLEDWSASELVDGIVEGQFAAIAAVHGARQAIATAVERVSEQLRQGGRLFYLGAGTSGRIAAQDAAELLPTFNWPAERAVSIMAGGEAAFTRSVEGAEDDEAEAPRQLDAARLGERDVVIGLAASGRTPFTLSGLRHARERGALTLAIHNNRDAALGDVAAIEILLDTGPELLAGSTRMKAGTAQKAALNSISTAVMIRLGYVYRGLMVEMRAGNEKLRGRAVAIVRSLTGASQERALAALSASDFSIRHAVLMVEKGLDEAGAEALLRAHGGDLRQALV